MKPGADVEFAGLAGGSTAVMVRSKVTCTGVPPKVSIPIQFMRALLYAQDSHKRQAGKRKILQPHKIC